MTALTPPKHDTLSVVTTPLEILWVYKAVYDSILPSLDTLATCIYVSLCRNADGDGQGEIDAAALATRYDATPERIDVALDALENRDLVRIVSRSGRALSFQLLNPSLTIEDDDE